MIDRLLQELLGTCRDLRSARDERGKRTVKMQQIASRARVGDPLAKDDLRKLDRQPVVWDVGDVVGRICVALDRYEKELCTDLLCHRHGMIGGEHPCPMDEKAQEEDG